MERNKLPVLRPEHYYFNERGLIVFTEVYHRERGSCCQSGCKHCPYGFKGKKKNSEY